jgi:hypothetical protein
MDSPPPHTVLARQVLAHLALPQGMDHSVQIAVVDRSRGECEENYFIRGQKSSFDSVHHFAAAALLAIIRHQGLTVEALDGLEVAACDPEPWMIAYDRRLRAGSALCFPREEILGFKPPAEVHRLLWLEPKLSGTEECFACEASTDFVFLYWHTTG